MTGRDIIALCYADWHASWSTPQQLMSRLAPASRVLYVDQPRSMLYGLKRRDPQGAGVWRGPRVQELRPNLFVYHPPHAFLPVQRMPAAVGKRCMLANGLALAYGIRRAAHRLGFRDPIVWNFSVLHGPAVPLLERCLTIYDICDEWEHYEPREEGKQLVRWVEDRLCRGADLLFVATERARAKRAAHPELHMVHHGADYPHFAAAADPATPVPEDIARLPRPVIGSVGVIDPARFDVELLEGLARARPQWSFALAGPLRADMDPARLRACPNVYLLGNKALDSLPGYLKGMDACLIPYRVNDATRDIYPLKLMEYLSAGRPVVSPPLPAVTPYEGAVEIADGPGATAAALDAILARGPDAAGAAARQAVGRANSWEHRVAEKLEHVERLLES